MKSFEKWETEELERTYGLTVNKKMILLETWLQNEHEITPRETETLESLRLRLEEYASFWGEEDIKVFFIMPVIQLVDFCLPPLYRTFMEVTFQAEVTDISGKTDLLRGRVEMVVATGKQRPQTPFFFLNEYKAQVKSVSDPQGQLLVAMLAAQSKNNGLNLPIYGMYNIGQFFFFMILHQKEYVVTKGFDATDFKDLQKVVMMLKFVKNHIENVVKS